MKTIITCVSRATGYISWKLIRIRRKAKCSQTNSISRSAPVHMQALRDLTVSGLSSPFPPLELFDGLLDI
jgi:hypothetical protein